MIIYLIRRGGRPRPLLRRSDRRYIWPRDATIPGDYCPEFLRDERTGCPSPVCLAPHGVFPASRLTAWAVSSYLAFSPLPRATHVAR